MAERTELTREVIRRAVDRFEAGKVPRPFYGFVEGVLKPKSDGEWREEWMGKKRA